MKRSRLSFISWILLLLTILAGTVESSSGDADFSFQRCVYDCIYEPEDRKYIIFVNNATLIGRYPPLGYSYVNWTKNEECAYDCMTFITNDRLKQQLPILKYYGHWPFRRYFGLEEGASSLFSILNMLPHLGGLLSILDNYSGYFRHFPFTIYLIAYGVCAINAWFASTLYHAKKTEWSTSYDLSSALILSACGLLVALKRFTYPWLPQYYEYFYSLYIVIAVIYRLYHMLFIGDISFTVHMHTCIAIIALTTLCYLLYFFNPLYQYYYYRKGSGLTWAHFMCLLMQIWFIFAAMFEILDFPPLFDQLVDAHAMWHLMTIPIGFFWYYYWNVELDRFLLEKKRREEKSKEMKID
jgi:post-GPI attachment to proteins factor 3